jgi:hypothetical protein
VRRDRDRSACDSVALRARTWARHGLVWARVSARTGRAVMTPDACRRARTPPSREECIDVLGLRLDVRRISTSRNTLTYSGDASTYSGQSPRHSGTREPSYTLDGSSDDVVQDNHRLIPLPRRCDCPRSRNRLAMISDSGVSTWPSRRIATALLRRSGSCAASSAWDGRSRSVTAYLVEILPPGKRRELARLLVASCHLLE